MAISQQLLNNKKKIGLERLKTLILDHIPKYYYLLILGTLDKMAEQTS
jgi:hypothetical protein